MRDRDVGKVRIDGFYNLVIVVPELLKLEIKVVKPCDDSFDDKTASVMLQSSFAEQLVETDMLLFIEPERILVTRCSGLPVGYVCQFSVGIHR